MSGLAGKRNLVFDTLREAFGRASQEAKKLKVDSLSIAMDTFTSDQISAVDAAYALSEAFTLATYEFEDYKQKSNEPDVDIEMFDIFTVEEKDEVTAALQVGQAFGEGTNSARTLVNTPGNMLTATDIAEYSKELASRYDFEIEILEKKDMEKLGMGAMLAVNKGSTEPPLYDHAQISRKR